MSMCMGKAVSFILLWSLSGTVLIPLHAQNAQPGISPVLQTLGDLWDYERAGRPPNQRISFEFPEAYINLNLSTSLKLKPRPRFWKAVERSDSAVILR